MPLEERTREIAVGLFELVASLPIISPHGHVDPGMLVANGRFSSAADLFIYHNHYVTRLLHADGVDLSLVRAPRISGSEVEAREHAIRAWEIFGSRWHLFAGTSSGYWFVRELRDIFEIEDDFSSDSAERIRLQIEEKLDRPEFRPRALFEKFDIQLLATTDSPADDLEAHRALNAGLITGRIAPTLRPDAFINPLASGWKSRIEQLCAQTGEPLTQEGFVSSLAKRREYFIRNGAVSVDIGAEDAFTTVLDDAQANSLFQQALRGEMDAAAARTFRGHMIAELVRQSCDDGLVITFHVGVHRNHSSATFGSFGADVGADIPIRAEFTNNLKPVLERYGLHPNLNLILFSLDESTWSRELAPLAGFYPSVYIGAPWWFLDAPFSARRFREATVETAGFYRGSGFIDDTRAFLSIPARHEMARRVDSAFLAELVIRGQITLSEAEQVAVDLVTTIPERAFKL